jgi:hypothetical protein
MPFLLQRVCWPLGRGSYLRIEPDIHWLVQLVGLPSKIGFVCACQSQTNQRGHWELALSCPVGVGKSSLAPLPARSLWGPPRGLNPIKQGFFSEFRESATVPSYSADATVTEAPELW